MMYYFSVLLTFYLSLSCAPEKFEATSKETNDSGHLADSPQDPPNDTKDPQDEGGILGSKQFLNEHPLGGDPEKPDNTGNSAGSQPSEFGNTHKTDSLSQSDSQIDCSQDGVTVAKLLTKAVENGQPGNYLEYEISKADCEGKFLQLKKAKILFDVDAVSSSIGKGEALPFEVTAEGNFRQQGKLFEVAGCDLFDKCGGEFFHNRSLHAVDIKTSAKSFKLRIELLGRVFLPFDQLTGGCDVVLPTYLRFGDSVPVRIDVPFNGCFTSPI